MPRPAGKLGRLPFDPERPHLMLERYLDPRHPLSRSGLPPVPLTEDVDRASHVASWPMYGNDSVGDCTIAGAGHMFGAWTAYNGNATGEALFADGEILRTYSAISGYDPAAADPETGENPTDAGCVMMDVLARLRTTGMTDTTGKAHKVVGYARLGNPADEDLLGQVLDVFGTVYTGIQVQPSIQREFADEAVWTYTPGEEFEGGHCVVLQRRAPAGSRHGILEYVSWGGTVWADFGFQAHAATEAWAVVTEDWVRANGTTPAGMDLQQLLSDMHYVG